MAKKILALTIILLALMTLCACNTEASVPVQPEQSVENTRTRQDLSPINYSNKVYYVEDDMPAGGYIITCTGSEYGMDVVIFNAESDYNKFCDSDSFTAGEFQEAVEQYAWADFYLYQDDQTYIQLKKGNVILLNAGICEFTKFEPNNSDVIYSGIYIVGEDIDAGNYNITCTSDYLTIALFENQSAYLDYQKSNRFSFGDESDAIQAYAYSTDFSYKNNTTFINLKDGTILMIEYGDGEIKVDTGPIIN